MKHVLVIILLLFAAQLSLSAQIKEMIFSDYGGIMVMVTSSGEPLEGALVEMAMPKDTIRTFIGSDGAIEIEDFFHRDSMVLSISCLGYKKETYRTRLDGHSVMYTVNMREDPQMLNAIIVRDNAIAMVVHGDTTIFNASAFETMEKDPLRALLEKLPGVSVDNGKVTANGVEVRKILINGTSLFGNDVNSAMDMIYSSEVKKVKIYDQHDQDRIIAADTLGSKERVVDVLTKKPVSRIGSLDIGIASGIYTDRGHDGKYAWMAGGSANYGRVDIEKPNINFRADGGRNMKQNSPVTVPDDNASVLFNITGKKQGTYNYNFFASADYGKSLNDEFTSDIYSAGYGYNERNVEHGSSSSDQNFSVFYMGRCEFAVGNKASIMVSSNGRYNIRSMFSADRTVSMADLEKSVTNVRNNDCAQDGTISVGIAGRMLGSKRGRTFRIHGNYTAGFGSGSGERKDDADESLQNQWITFDALQSSHKVNLGLKYNEPIAGGLSFYATYDFEGKFSSSDKLSWNELLSKRDTLNTHRFTHNDIQNMVRAGLSYMNPREKLKINLFADYRNIYQLRKESFPTDFSAPDSYNQLSPSLWVIYEKSPFNVSFVYREEALVPSIEQRRAVIDDANPLFLTAGNPELKLPVSRIVTVNFLMTSSLINTTWRANLEYKELSNDIVRKTEYFSEETILDKYGYTVPAGSELSVPVTVNGSRTFSTSFSPDIYSKYLKSTFTPSVSYGYFRKPFFLMDDRHDNLQHCLSAGLSYRSSFSRYIGLKVSTVTGIGRNLRDGDKVYDFLTEDVSAEVKFHFMKRLKASIGVDNILMATDSSIGGYEKTGLGASLGILLGKSKDYSLSVVGKDLLGMNNNKSISVTDFFVRSRYSSILGRSVMVVFEYKF
ncbi:MAG: hypothetical protein NC115_11220 [Bacteroidales bacterium]|nr:hypothetical protein [Bacteroidales bacterium]